MPFKTKKNNLSNQLVDTMTELITSGQWTPGMKLPNELELASSFNVSRNIMREAMKILENFGILGSRAGIGTLISETALSAIHNMQFFNDLKNNSSIETILETRLIIEPELAYFAAVRGAENEFERLKSIVSSRSFDRGEDFDFHMCIANAAGNNVLESLLMTMLDQLRSSKYIEFDRHAEQEVVEHGYSDHQLIADAIVSRDADKARELMRSHLFTRIDTINSSYNTDIK